MLTSEKYDIVIIGGGLAGLSLATRLASPRFQHLQVLVIEPRTHYVRDRTWCYWANQRDRQGQVPIPNHPFEAAVAVAWPSWEVMHGVPNTPSYAAVEKSARHVYEMIPADRFYEDAERAIASTTHIKLLKGVSVREAVIDCDHVTIETNHGTVQAALAFDSRPPENVSNAAWIQRFQGFELETEVPIFNVNRATLMDFTVTCDADSEAGRVHFIYVLPLSARRALVEDTWFAPASDKCSDVDYQAHIKTYLKRRFALETYEVVHREQGVIPMDPLLRPSKHASRLVKIGTAGGMARASSGYAFFETQRACDAIAAKLATRDVLSKEFLLPRWRKDVSYWMDGIFLRVLKQYPALAPKIFFDLFAKVPPDALARFLSGVATPLDAALVVSACPKMPFLKAAFFSR